MGEAVRLYRAAAGSIGRDLGQHEAGRTVLSLFFKTLFGIERIFHFETLDDPGFALLTGGDKVLDRSTLGALIRSVSSEGVERLMAQTRSTLGWAMEHTVSIDEHSIARFTRKFAIPKGYHTIRNKKMKVEKLYFTFDVVGRRLLSLIAMPGDASLAEVSRRLMPSLRRRAHGGVLRVILDAGAAEDHKPLIELVNHPRQVTIVRVPRRPAYRKAWKKIPEDQWCRLEEAGPYKDAPPKVVHLAETQTKLKVCYPDGSRWDGNVRTIVVREQGRNHKERWHALWVFRDDTTPAWDIVEEFRLRQHHEQRYRVLVHDAFVDTAPSGYDKDSKDVERPLFDEAALTLYAWIAAVVSNIVDEFSETLPGFHRAHLRTLRRWFFEAPAELYLGRGTLIVFLQPKRLHELWLSLIQTANARATRIPWMEDRRLVLSMEPPIPQPDQPEVARSPF
jgi:hypothetical protein